MKHWYLIYTKPHKEALVLHQLENRDIEVFFPTLQFERGYNRGVRVEPYFPSYLFVRMDLSSERAHELQWVVGVRSMVHFGNGAAIVPDHVVETLRDRLQPYQERTLRKAEWLFRPGQHVEIANGPFAGFDAVFQKGLKGSDRVQVLLNALGAWTRAELSVLDLKAA